MIHFVRTASVAPGKMADAVAFAKKIAAHLAKKPGIKVEVSVPVAGHPNRITWYSQHSDLAAFEATMNKIATDSKYAALVRESATLFLPGSINDSLWRSV